MDIQPLHAAFDPRLRLSEWEFQTEFVDRVGTGINELHKETGEPPIIDVRKELVVDSREFLSSSKLPDWAARNFSSVHHPQGPISRQWGIPSFRQLIIHYPDEGTVLSQLSVGHISQSMKVNLDTGALVETSFKSVPEPRKQDLEVLPFRVSDQLSLNFRNYLDRLGWDTNHFLTSGEPLSGRMLSKTGHLDGLRYSNGSVEQWLLEERGFCNVQQVHDSWRKATPDDPWLLRCSQAIGESVIQQTLNTKPNENTLTTSISTQVSNGGVRRSMKASQTLKYSTRIDSGKEKIVGKVMWNTGASSFV